MQPLEQKLFDFIGKELHELAWHFGYPIHPNIGIWCLLEGFRSQGVDVFLKDREAVFMLNKELDSILYSFQSKLSFEEILKGWNRKPESTPKTLYDSICEVYDRMGSNLQERKVKAEWENFSDYEIDNVRRKMEVPLLNFFKKYHENILVSVSGDIPKLNEPKIFFKVIADYPLDILKNSIFTKALMTPTAETLLEMDWDFNSAEYYPSEAVMTDFFFGKYLNRLSKEKGYPLKYDGDRLHTFMRQGREALKPGHQWDK